jgi:hypothetical protein
MPTLKEYGNWKWATLHAEAASFSPEPTEEERIAFVAYLENYSKIFPCPKCRPHLMRYIRDHPVYPHTENAKTLFMYVFDLHEEVNNHKPNGIQSNIEPKDVWKAFEPGAPWQGFGGYLLLGEKDIGPNGKISFDSSSSDLNSNINVDDKKEKTLTNQSSDTTGNHDTLSGNINDQEQITDGNKKTGLLASFAPKPNLLREVILWIAIGVLVSIIIGLIVGWVKFANRNNSLNTNTQNGPLVLQIQQQPTTAPLIVQEPQTNENK